MHTYATHGLKIMQTWKNTEYRYRHHISTRAEQLLRWATVWPHRPNIGGGCYASFRWGAGSPSYTMSPGPRQYHRAMWYPDPSSHLARIDMSRKLGGGAVPPFGGAESTSNIMWPGARPTSVPSGILIHPAVWPEQTWAENWGLCPFGGGRMCPQVTQCGPDRGLPPYQVVSKSVQPFDVDHNTRTSQTDRHTDKHTDNGPITYGEPFCKRSPKNHTSKLHEIFCTLPVHCVHPVLWMTSCLSHGPNTDNDLEVGVRERSVLSLIALFYKSSAVAQMGDRGHNRHGPKRGGRLCPFRGSWDPV